MRLALSAAAVFCAMWSVQQANAQGLALPPGWYDWTGVYVGINVGYGASATTQSFSGVVAGGQVGANLQYQNLVFGVDVDGDWSSQQGSSGTPALTVKLPWLATARLRIGSAHDRIQYYATGGVAYTRFTADPGNGMGVSSTRTGWTAGIGQETAIQNVLLRFEVLYLEFLGSTETPPGAPIPVSVGRLSGYTARVGLSYKFGWPGN